MKNNLTLVILPALLMAGCSKDHLFDCLKGSGKEITVIRTATPFHTVEMHDKVDLEFHRGYRPEIEVTGGANLLEGIITEVNGTTLEIRNENTCNWVRDFSKRITVRVYCDSLTRIANDGSGDVRFADTLICTDFTYENLNATGYMDFLFAIHRFTCNISNGTASMQAAGTADISLVYNNGYGPVRHENLQTGITYVTNSGSGDILLYVTMELYAIIEEAGDIYYRGDPTKVEQTTTGSGKLIKQ